VEEHRVMRVRTWQIKTSGIFEIFQIFGSMITNNARCACEIKSRNAKAKAAFKRTKFFSPTNWT
jgi:hypothetical protein